MAIEKKHFLAFNRGVVSKIGMSRIDLERFGMSAEIQANMVPRVLGSAMLRPGLEFIDFCREDLNLTRHLPFVFGVDDTALIEVGDDAFMRIRIDDVLLARAAHSSVVIGGTFPGDIADWTDVSTGAAQVTYDATTGDAKFESDGTDWAALSQSLNVSAPDQGVEHALDIDCGAHMVVRIGTTSGATDILADTPLQGSGEHHIAFTPNAATIHIELRTDREYPVYCSKFDFDITGNLQLIHPWGTEDKIRSLRWTQSGDVIYVASLTNDVIATRQKKIVRYGTRSWGLVDYAPEDGPFRTQNITKTTMVPSAIKHTVGGADITLTASEDYFDDDHINFGPGALFYVDSQGQEVQEDLNVANEATNVIRVTGSGQSREFNIAIVGTWTGTIQLQFANFEDGPWTLVTGESYTVNTTKSFDDAQDDAIIYYRLQMTSFGSGSADSTLSYAGGSIRGVARIFSVTSPTVAVVTVLKDFGSVDASADWAEGDWSTFRGYPSTCKIHEGRLWWAGQDKIFGSVSDGYESWDPLTVGDSGPILRTIGIGPIRKINWFMSLKRLFMGTTDMSAAVDAGEIAGNAPLGAQSNREDNPMTPTNFNVKRSSVRGLFVDRTEQRLYELAFDTNSLEYEPIDLSIFAPDFNEIGIAQIAVQMKPDIRVHCVRTDGTVGMLVYDRAENVICWIDVDANPNGELNGSGAGFQHCVEDVAVLPGVVEDQVYYTVKRSNGASTGNNQGEERHLEKWALESEAEGGLANKQADSFTHYSGAPISTLTNLNHLAGLSCIVWADGAERGTVTPGTTGTFDADLSGLDGAPFSEIVIGLPYTGRWKSTKLAAETGSAERGTSGIGLHDRKKVNRIGFVLRNSHYRGLQYGPTFDLLSDLPAVEEGLITPADTIWVDYDEDNFPFGGDWDPDARICIECQAPRPCNILSAVIHMETLEFE